MTQDKAVRFTGVNVLVGDADQKQALSIGKFFKELKFGKIAWAGDIKSARTQISEGDFDVVVLADNLGGGMFKVVRDIRHNRLGHNPFIAVIGVLAPEHIEGAKGALFSGVDDVLVKPISGSDIADRIRRISRTESKYVVTSEYIGPDRRKSTERSTGVRSFNIPRTLADKMRGKSVDYGEYSQEIKGLVENMRRARLTAQGGRLASLAEDVIASYVGSDVTPVTQTKLQGLRDVLADAAVTAKRLSIDDVAQLCKNQIEAVEEFIERYTSPMATDIALLKKIATNVAMAVQAGVAIDETATRSKKADPEPEDDDEDMDEVPLEFQFVKKGDYLFRIGDEAVAAYVLASGSIGLFREADGKPLPIARVKPGEFFGEMAIIEGTARRANAVALEDTTVSLVSRDMVKEKLASCDPLIRSLIATAIQSLRLAHDTFTPRPRSLADMISVTRATWIDLVDHLDKLTTQDDEETEAQELKSRFENAFNAVTEACTPLLAKDRRGDRVLKDTELTPSAEQGGDGG